jgi:hypothetical protein
MSNRLGSAKSLLVTQKLVIHGSDNAPAQKTVQVNERLRCIFPATYRSDIVSDQFQKIHVVSGNSSLTVIDEKVVDGYENRYDRYQELILFRSRTLLQNRLPSMGVNVAISSIGRFEGKPAYVIGAQYPDETVPQIWLDKETFRPFRWILAGHSEGGEKDGLEVRYLNWREVDGMWYPMRIEFYRARTLFREILVQQVQVDPPLSRELFDIDHLRSVYPPQAALTPGQDETDELTGVQKTIEEFKKIYE